MKIVIAVLMLLPLSLQAQKPDLTGIYKMPEPTGKVHLKFWDTIRESFTFTPDSFKYTYSVMRPNGRVAVSVEYDEYGMWKLVKDTALQETDKATGKPISFNRIYAILDDGRIDGYFEPAYAADSTTPPGSDPHLVFIRRSKIFYYSGPPSSPLKKGE